MKVLIIGCFDLYLHPYVEKYIKIMNENRIDFKFIYWNRLNEKNDLNDCYIPFNYSMNTYKSMLKKVSGYLKFRKYVLNHIHNHTYDKLILLTTQTAVIIGNKYLKKYKNKYIFDYRDVTYERLSLYKKYVKSVINQSNFTVMSSPGFISNFDTCSNRISIMHNVKDYPLDILPAKVFSNKIRISFWGMIRQPNYYIKIFNVFGNDERFQFDLYGDGYNTILKDEISKKKYCNIFLHGRYNKDDIIEFVKNTDVLVNAYSNNSIQKLALTVKMYEGIKYKIPMIIQKDSYMDNYLNKYAYPHFSIDFDNFIDSEEIKSSIINDLKEYKRKLENSEIENEIFEEINQTTKKIQNFLLEE